jgi:hypothetical protein
VPISDDHENYEDENGRVLFELDPGTGSCIEAKVYASRADRKFSTYCVLERKTVSWATVP